ncbi:MAG: 2-oxoglutarate dehydrogenase E1 component, partial [Saprospiraceae bacterium]|nr:2-oxoglutarate dehydrogenase E1 component [Saprospiraceae bacterium]
RKDRAPHLDLSDYNLTDNDLDHPFEASKEIGLENGTLRDIIEKLQTVYIGNIGFEFTHIKDKERRMWLRDRIENRNLKDDFGIPVDKKKRILAKLNGAVVFEQFLHTKYLAQKRFSLEGGETTIPALDAMINLSVDMGVEEVVIGMAHRGRLNVLANIMNKTYEQIFNEFEGTAVPDLAFGDGDVKYHLGFSSQIVTSNGKKIHLKLVPNPSHLESVDPIVQGFARAKADILYDGEYDKILPVLIHGDAAIAGQGIVYETAQMSQLKGYYTGGTVHFVINNQIGFTTDFDDARTSTYSTGVANMIQAPVFHVNGDDPEAVIYATELAIEYRQRFNTDVFVDMVCYRKHGHNEGDDPKFTQPRMYEIISSHPNPREIYSHELSARGDVDKALGKEMEKEFWEELQRRLDMVKEKPLPYEYQEPEQAWRKLKKKTSYEDFVESPKTGITKKKAVQIIENLLTVPEGFNTLRGVDRLLKGKNMLWKDGKLDWAMAELMAYGSILLEGKDVRMSGQDVKRGTFSHRHATFFDAKTYEEFNRLAHLEKKQGKFLIYNSLLSEFGVLGFEYGYSLATPESLVVWEAQFGDFYNGAQVILDQYITAAESKWQRMSGLVMLLPHGYEGQGPEHSSARMERFLQSAAEFNITVANLTNPANFFHLLRRQLARPFRKPLIVMSPKSLLRHPACVATIDEFTTGSRFQEVYDDVDVTTEAEVKNIKKVLFCSGKIYYDLVEARKNRKLADVAIVRLEQLYPFPLDQMELISEKYAHARKYWVQEEPSNMGAWQYFWSFYRNTDIDLIARKSSASTATGYKKVHEEQQQSIIDQAFT